MLLVVTDFLSADKYTSVDVLVSGTADYFFSSCAVFRRAFRASQNTKKRVKMIGDTTHQNV